MKLAHLRMNYCQGVHPDPHPPYSYLTAWWSNTRKRANTMSDIFCSSGVPGVDVGEGYEPFLQCKRGFTLYNANQIL